MNANVNGRAILSGISKEPHDRKRVTFFLSEELCDRFKAVCEKESAPMSRVLEELMKDFLLSIEKKR